MLMVCKVLDSPQIWTKSGPSLRKMKLYVNWVDFLMKFDSLRKLVPRTYRMHPALPSAIKSLDVQKASELKPVVLVDNDAPS